MAQAIVTLPNGRRARVTADTRDQVLAEADRLAQDNPAQAPRQPQQQQAPGVAETVGREGLTTFFTNFFEAPEQSLNLLNEALNRGVGMAVPGLGGAQALAQRFPRRTDVDLPNPTGEDVLAGAQLAGEAAGAVATGDFGQFSGFEGAREQQAERSRQGRQENPVAGQVGAGLGNAATIVTGRAPVAQAARNRRLQKPSLLFSDLPQPGGVVSDVRGITKSIAQSTPVKKAIRTAGRSAEAGLEGAIIGIMEDQDPAELAGLAAGGQAAGLAVTGLAPNVSKTKLALGIISLGVLARLGQDFSPGENNAFDAFDFAFDKTASALTIGAAATLAGVGGRLGGPKGIGKRMADLAPDFADAVTAIPRTTAVTMAGELFREEQQGGQPLDQTLITIGQNLDQFNEETQRKLQRGLQNNRMREVLDGLMRDRSFREKFDSLQ